MLDVIVQLSLGAAAQLDSFPRNGAYSIRMAVWKRSGVTYRV